MHLILINELTPGEKNKAWVDMLLKYLLSQCGGLSITPFQLSEHWSLDSEVWNPPCINLYLANHFIYLVLTYWVINISHADGGRVGQTGLCELFPDKAEAAARPGQFLPTTVWGSRGWNDYKVLSGGKWAWRRPHEFSVGAKEHLRVSESPRMM